MQTTIAHRPDAELASSINAAIDVLCKAIDDARAAGLTVELSFDASDTWAGRREDGQEQVRTPKPSITRNLSR